ncbi:SRPBCC family protein [Streptomyces sp. NPDC005533]|uniref:SRPBCC family protein n=1 Tax=Streptomyces sp. NPDC005533 TaxID=3364723 RepID=UPI00367C9D03
MSSTTGEHAPHTARETPDPLAYAFTRRAWVDAPPARVYELVADVSAISRWSPHATRAAYDHSAGPRPGAWFSGRNRKDGKQ